MAHSRVTSESPRAYMTLDELANAAPIPAAQDMPAEMREMLSQHSGLYVRSESKPKMDCATEKVPGAPGMWQVLGSPHDEELRTTIPGKEQIELNAENTAAATEGASSTDGYRPPWMPMEYMPRLAPFRVGDHVFLEPRVQEVGNRFVPPSVDCCRIWFDNEDAYYSRRYVSSGYPGSFGTRMLCIRSRRFVSRGGRFK